MVIYSCDVITEYSAAITPVFSVTWFFKNHYHMLIGAQITFNKSITLNQIYKP